MHIALLAAIAALANAKPGDVVQLAPGDYPNLVIQNVSFPPPGVTLDTAGSTLEGLTVQFVRNLTIRNADGPMTSTPGAGVDPKTIYGWTVTRSTGVSIVNANLHGGGALATQSSGLTIAECVNCAVLNSTFGGLHDGIDHVRSPGLKVIGNSFTGLFDDAIRGDAASIDVENNAYSGGHCDATDVDHPDFVQIWPIGFPDGKPQAGGVITVKNNRLAKGGMGCGTVHGFFLRMDFPGFGAVSAPQLLTVSGNSYVGPGDDCVYVHAALPGETAATTVSITGNTCQATPCGDKYQAAAGFWVAGVDPAKLTFTGNAAAVFQVNAVRHQTPPPAGNTILACAN